MPLIVPNVCRYTINGTFSDRPTANILDMEITGGGPGVTRNEAIVEQAEIILEHWYEDVLANAASAYTGTSVSWVDLDSEDGSTGSTTVGNDSKSFPKAGAQTTNAMTGNTAFLVKKVTNGSRGTRDGRWYIPGVLESDTDGPSPQILLAARRTQWQNAMNTMLPALNQSDFLGLFDSRMVVTHITERGPEGPNGRPGEPLQGVGIPVSSLQVEARLATQRRRLRK